MRISWTWLLCLTAATATVTTVASTSPAIAARPDEAKSKKLYDEGMGAANASNMALAVQLFRESLEANPKNFLAAFDLGGAFEAKGDKENALVNYQRTVEIKPDFAEAQNQLATLYLLHRRDNDKAIHHFRLALLAVKPYVEARFKLAYTRAQALRNLAVAYAQKGMYGIAQGVGASFLQDPDLDHDADATIQTLVKRTDASLQPALQRGFPAELDGIRKLLHGNKVDAALQQYTAFAKAHPTSVLSAIDQWDLHEGLGLALAMKKQPADGIVREFTQARDAAEHLPYPKLASSTFNLACALSEANKVDEALAQLESLLWLEALTRHDPAVAGKPRYHDKIHTDSSLAAVRASAKLAPLLARYGFQ